MPVHYFQFRRLGLLVPFFFIGACVLAGFVRDWLKILPEDHFSFMSIAALLFSILNTILRAGLELLPAQKIYKDLEEEWIITRDVDEFMYFNLKQWAGCGIGVLAVSEILRAI
jgi:hypothetical protein